MGRFSGFVMLATALATAHWLHRSSGQWWNERSVLTRRSNWRERQHHVPVQIVQATFLVFTKQLNTPAARMETASRSCGDAATAFAAASAAASALVVSFV